MDWGVTSVQKKYIYVYNYINIYYTEQMPNVIASCVRPVLPGLFNLSTNPVSVKSEARPAKVLKIARKIVFFFVICHVSSFF